MSPRLSRLAKARSTGYEIIDALRDRSGFDDLFGNLDSALLRDIAGELGEIALRAGEHP